MQVRSSRAAWAALICASGCFGLSADAAPTWQVQASFSGSTSSSATRSLRGIALSPDGSEEYVGFILGTSGTTAVREYSSGVLVPQNPPITNSVSLGGFQPKGVAVDDRGYVYATDSNSSGSTAQKFVIYNSSLSTLESTTTMVTQAHPYQLGGIAVQKIGSDYFAYVASNKGTNGASGSGGTIERYNVDNPSAPVLDTSWASSGVLNLHTATGGNVDAQMNGLDVAADGTIYATADDSTSASIRGDTLYKITFDPSTGAPTIASTAVTEAMDVALYGGNVYVAEYNSTNSRVGVYSASTLGSVDTYDPTATFPHTDTSADSGYSGIAINGSGQIYLSDQIYDTSADPIDDRVLVSSALPEPASLAGLMIGGVGLLRRRRV